MTNKNKKITYTILIQMMAMYILVLAYFQLDTILSSIYPRIEFINKTTDIITLLILLIISIALFSIKITIDENEKK